MTLSEVLDRAAAEVLTKVSRILKYELVKPPVGECETERRAVVRRPVEEGQTPEELLEWCRAQLQPGERIEVAWYEETTSIVRKRSL